MRCAPKHQRHSDWSDIYGHVKICKRWDSFENFLEDMGVRPLGTQLIRRNKRRGYSPSNCYWGTREELANGRTNAVKLSLSGVTMTMSQWAHAMRVNPSVIRSRLVRGWTVEQILTTPPQPGHKPEVRA